MTLKGVSEVASSQGAPQARGPAHNLGVTDALSAHLAPVIAELYPPKPTGRSRIDTRRTLDAILFRVRSGCQWNHLPNVLPDDSSVHRTFQRWVRLRVLDCIWSSLIED